MSARDPVVTGIGLLSCLGEGVETHRALLENGPGDPVIDTERFAPYTVHPLPEVDWSGQIPRRGDQRQMETWQRIGTYTAGLALADAGLAGDEALCGSMDMIVAAGGGERDTSVDAQIIEAAADRKDREVLINEKLTTELRPTLFLAQLSNLLAGNISIVHKVTGSSRTFMGEEGASISVVQTALARIRAGQSTHALVGGAQNTEHPDMLLNYELGGALHRGAWSSVWNRGGAEGGGVITGSGGAFLVIEAREHAEKRGARIYAALGPVVSRHTTSDGDELVADIAEMVNEAGAAELAVSAASGAPERTEAEASALSGIPLRGFSSVTGTLKEAQLPFAIALAALAIESGQPVRPFTSDELDAGKAPEAVLATTIGYAGAEGMVRVTGA